MKPRRPRRLPPVIVHAALSFDGRVLDAPPAAAEKTSADHHDAPPSRATLAGLLACLNRDFGAQRFDCTGGTVAARWLLAAGLVDEIHVTLHPRIVGGGDSTAFPTLTAARGPGADSLFPGSIPCRLLSLRPGAAGTCFVRYRVEKKTDYASRE
jgi:riboflavin biosynthesis pyrimidine reductase